MASKLIRWLTAIAIALAWGFAATIAPAHAAAPVNSAFLKLHHFKFYLDPALVPDLAFAKAALPKYVSDMNVILGKNTSRGLVFDPETDIILTDTQPQSDSAVSPLPTEGFEIWAHAVQTTAATSYGGYGSMDMSGAGVLAGLHWTRIYNPDALTPDQVLDYCTQISIMLHEMAHMFGAGIGEYYSMTSIQDYTGLSPAADINLYDATDAYWIDKPDFMSDPLLRVPAADTRAEYLSAVRFSGLTAAVLSGDYRNGVPSYDQFTVQVLGQSGQAVPGAEVKVWNINTNSPYASQLLYDVSADGDGRVTLPWGGEGGLHNSANLLRLIKVYQNGLPITEARFVSIFDSDLAQFVDGQASFVVVVRPANLPPSALSLSNAGIDENQPAGTPVGELTAVDPGDTVNFTFCGGVDDRSFQIAGSTLLSAVPFDYEIKPAYKICLRANDSRGGSLQKLFVIEVKDVPDTFIATFMSGAAGDGWVRESAPGTNKGGALNTSSNVFMLGNDAVNRRYRSVLVFQTGKLADNAIITKVTLKIRKQGLVGDDPFGQLGSLVVDMGKPFIGTSAGLQPGDFQAQAGLASAATFTRKPTAKGWYSAVFKGSAMSLVNLIGATQLRLRFTRNGSTGGDYLSIFSGNATPANRPVLVVEYELPYAAGVSSVP